MSTPNVLVFLDDGTGGFPTDITGLVRRPDGITRTMGREDYDTTISPGQLSLTLDNGDNTFYGAGVGWDEGPWDEGPWGGGGMDLPLDQKIRLVVNGRNKFTGYIQQAPLSWPDGGDEFSTIAITAVDALSKFQRLKLGSAFDEEIKADSSTLVAYYPLTGGSDTTVEYDASGSGAPNLTIYKPAGTTAPVWGTDYGAADGTTGVRFTVTGGLGPPVPAASCLVGNNGAAGFTTGANLHAELVFQTTDSLTQTFLNLFPWDVIGIFGGTVIVFGVGYGSGLNDGDPHVVSVEATIGGTYDVWIDGTKVGAAVATPATSSVFQYASVQVGDSTGEGGGSGHYNLARVSVGSARLSDARIEAHHLAALSDCAGETPAQRYTRVANYLGVAVGTLDTTGSRTLGPAAQAGKTLTDVLTDTSGAALGFAFVDGDGNLSSVNGSSTASQVTPVVSLDANWAAEDTSIQNDLDKLLNDITGQASSSSNIITARDADSIYGTPTSPGHGSYPGSSPYTWNVADDEQAFQLTWWTVRNFSQPRPRAPQLTLDLLTMADTSDAETVTLGSYIQITDMPEQSPIGTDLGLIAEGLTEVISDVEWSLSTNNVQRDVFTGWILGDPVYGILGETAVLFPT